MDCNKFRDSLSDYLAGDIEDSLQGDFDLHRDNCQVCSNELVLYSNLVSMIKRSPYPQTPEIWLEIESKYKQARSKRTVLKLTAGIAAAAAILIAIFINLTGGSQTKDTDLVKKKEEETAKFKTLAKDIAMEVGLKHDEARKLEQLLIPQVLMEIASGKKELNGIVFGVTRSEFQIGPHFAFSFELSEKEISLLTKLQEISANYFMEQYTNDLVTKLKIESEDVKDTIKQLITCKKNIKTARSKILKLKIASENEARAIIGLEREKIKSLNVRIDDNLDQLFNMLEIKKLLKFLPIIMESNYENSSQFMLAIPSFGNR